MHFTSNIPSLSDWSLIQNAVHVKPYAGKGKLIDIFKHLLFDVEMSVFVGRVSEWKKNISI